MKNFGSIWSFIYQFQQRLHEEPTLHPNCREDVGKQCHYSEKSLGKALGALRAPTCSFRITAVQNAFIHPIRSLRWEKRAIHIQIWPYGINLFRPLSIYTLFLSFIRIFEYPFISAGNIQIFGPKFGLVPLLIPDSAETYRWTSQSLDLALPR